MPLFYFDSTYILIVIGMIVSLMASAKLQRTFSKYSGVFSKSGLTGQQTAELILERNGLSHVRVVPIAGQLTDHYNPANKTLALSESVYNKRSLAAVCVAAHECGHAVQDKTAYAPFNLRSAIVPTVNIGQAISIPILIIGAIIGSYNLLVPIGIMLFSFTLIFQLVTLPVEYNASSRALDMLAGYQILAPDEIKGGQKVLSAAALTYVAGVFASLMSLLRIILIFGGGRNRD